MNGCTLFLFFSLNNHQFITISHDLIFYLDILKYAKFSFIFAKSFTVRAYMTKIFILPPLFFDKMAKHQQKSVKRKPYCVKSHNFVNKCDLFVFL